MDFDSQRALDYARSLARPRLAGSGEEERVAAEVSEKLEAAGWRVGREPFAFASASETLVPLVVLASQLLVATALLTPGSATVQAVLAGALLALAVSVGGLIRAARAGSLAPSAGRSASLWNRLCLRLGQRYDSANLIATLPSPAAAADRPHVTLVAHYDSKSQPVPIGLRIGLFVIALGGAVTFAALTLAALAFPWLGRLVWAAGAVTVLAGLPLLWLRAENESPGAIDNASGLGLVLHLAEVLAREPDATRQLRLTVLVTGAEELSVMGAQSFVRRHADELRAEAQAGRACVLNFDGIGVAGELKWVGRRGSALLGLLREACAESQLPFGPLNLPGALYDHIPFAELGMDAVSLIAVGPASWRVHTAADTVESLDVSGFEKAGRVALRVIKMLGQAG